MPCRRLCCACLTPTHPPPHQHTQGVEGVAEAIEYMLRGQHVGKVVIRIAEEE